MDQVNDECVISAKLFWGVLDTWLDSLDDLSLIETVVIRVGEMRLFINKGDEVAVSWYHSKTQKEILKEAQAIVHSACEECVQAGNETERGEVNSRAMEELFNLFE